MSSRTAATKQGAETLLDAAERLFLERGYANVSMQQIAEAAGFTKGATYYHFQSKDDLYFAVSRRLAFQLRDRLLEPFEETRPFEEQLRDSIRTVRAGFGGKMQRWWGDAGVIFSDQERERLMRETLGVDEPWMILLPAFRRAADEGIIRNLPPEAAARIFAGLVTTGLGIGENRWVPEADDPDEQDRIIDEIITVFLYGVQGKIES